MSLFNSWPVPKPLIFVGKVFRVESFDHNGTKVIGEKVKAKSLFKPYGYLIVKSPDLDMPTRLPIIHRDDFLLAMNSFEDPTFLQLKNEGIAELLVTYSPLNIDSRGFSLSPYHCLHYAICPSGTIDRYYQSAQSKKIDSIFGDFVYDGILKTRNHFSERGKNS